MENKFLFLKYFLIFSQVLTLIIFSVYLSHFFEESLDEYRPGEVIVDDFYPDDQELWTLKINGLIAFGFMATLFCIMSFGIYYVNEESLFGCALYFVAYLVWIFVFHSIVFIYDFAIPKRALIMNEILSTCLSLVFLLTIKRADNLEFVRVNDLSKSQTSVSVIGVDNPPYNPDYRRSICIETPPIPDSDPCFSCFQYYFHIQYTKRMTECMQVCVQRCETRR